MASAPGRELSSINFESMLGGPLMAVVNAQAQAAMSSVNFIKAVGFKPGNADDPTKAQTGEPIYVSFKYPKEVSPFEPAVPSQLIVTINEAGQGYTTIPTVNIAGGSGGSGLSITVTSLGPDGSITAMDVVPGTDYTAPPSATVATAPSGGTRATLKVELVPAKAAVAAKFETMMLEVPILTMLPIPFIRIEETTIDFNAKINSVEETKTDETFKASASLNATYQYPPLFSIASVKLKVSTSTQKNTQTGTKVDRTYSMAVHIRAVQDEMPAGMEKILGILEDAIQSQPTKAPPAIEA